MDKNKVKFGLKNVHYAVATIAANMTATYGTVKPWPGAVSLSLDPMGEPTNFYADDTIFFVAQPASGYQGDYESSVIPESVYDDIFKDAEDANGVIVEADGTETVHFAFMFEFAGDKNAIRHVLYNCTLSRPSVAGETKTETTEPQTTSATLTASTIYSAALKKFIVKANTRSTTDETVYANWYESVYLPQAETAPEEQGEG